MINVSSDPVRINTDESSLEEATSPFLRDSSILCWEGSSVFSSSFSSAILCLYEVTKVKGIETSTLVFQHINQNSPGKTPLIFLKRAEVPDLCSLRNSPLTRS